MTTKKPNYPTLSSLARIASDNNLLGSAICPHDDPTQRSIIIITVAPGYAALLLTLVYSLIKIKKLNKSSFNPDRPVCVGDKNSNLLLFLKVMRETKTDITIGRMQNLYFFASVHDYSSKILARFCNEELKITANFDKE